MSTNDGLRTVNSRSNTRQNHLKPARQVVEMVLARGLNEGDYRAESMLSKVLGSKIKTRPLIPGGEFD